MPCDTPSILPLAVFIAARRQALLCSASLLGGKSARQRTEHLVFDVLAAPTLTRRLERELDAFEALLALSPVKEDDGTCAPGTVPDPCDPVTDDLGILLSELRAARAGQTEFT